MHHLLCRKCYCKGNFRLARALGILGGDVELNPGPRQNEIHDELSMPTSAVVSVMDQTGIEEQEYMDSEVKKSSTLAMLSACHRKRLDAERVEEHCLRLLKMSENQRLRLQCETEEHGLLHLLKITGNCCTQKLRKIVLQDLPPSLKIRGRGCSLNRLKNWSQD